MSEVFKTLSEINVNGRTEQKNGLTYLSWAWAWAEVKKVYPDASYVIHDYGGKPYLYDENLGYMVATEVTIQGETLPMHLPVMDGANKAQKATDYTYDTKFKKDVVCKAATMFDINKTVMRCLVKNLAMFGLGLYIYAGEDLPDVTPEKMPPEDQEKVKQYAEKYGYTAESICTAYQVNSLSEFNADMAKQICQQIQIWSKQAEESGNGK